MRYVCPKDVKKMLVQQARSVYWKMWAAKHEYEKLKEGIWLERALALLRKKTNEEWTEKTAKRCQKKCFWKAGCRRNSLTLVGLMKLNVKPVTRRKAQKSTGFSIAQKGPRSDGKSQRLSENASKKPKLQRSGSGKEVLLRILSVKANGTGATAV